MRQPIVLAALGVLVLSGVQAIGQTHNGGRPDQSPAEADSALSADVVPPYPCTVTAVDAAKSTFTCHSVDGDRTFATGPQTQFSGGGIAGIAGLKAGANVGIASHRSDDNTQDVADQVTVLH